jgi:hypothetical protein
VRDAETPSPRCVVERFVRAGGATSDFFFHVHPLQCPSALGRRSAEAGLQLLPNGKRILCACAGKITAKPEVDLLQRISGGPQPHHGTRRLQIPAAEAE